MRERRKVPRYEFGKTGMLYPAGGGVGAKAAVLMISSEGCALTCDASPSVGKKCELYIDADGAQIGLEGQVVSKDEQGRTGLKFLSVDKDTRKRLSGLCATLRAQSLSAPVLGEVETDQPARVAAAEQEPARAPAAPWAAPPAPRVPERVRERRRVPRYVSELRAGVLDSSSGVTANAALITLSVLGGCLEGEGLPEPGRPCEVLTEWEGRPLRLPGEVIWKSKTKRVGIKFASLNPEDERLLRQVCANLRLQPLAPLPPEPE